MQPVEFIESNLIMRAPESMPDVQPLHVYNDGQQSISCWELTDADIETLKQTRRLWLGVVANGAQPPVWMMTETPFTHTIVAVDSRLPLKP